MNSDSHFSRLFRNMLLALLICAALVLLCYYFIDGRIAFFVHRHNLPRYSFLKWLTYPPPIVQAWSPALLAGLMWRRIYGPFQRWEKMLIAACVSMVLADQFRETLAYAFGRYWPETWIDNNPSLIQNGAYGFHAFRGGTAYGSFPSGHTARTLAVAAIIWMLYPKWRWACCVASVAIATGLVGMNYHFLGDIIAGGFVGAIVGAFTVYWSGLAKADRESIGCRPQLR